MKARSKSTAVLAFVVGFAVTAAAGAVRAEDMAGMKMDKSKTEKAAGSGAKSQKGAEKVDIAVTENGFEPSTVEVKKGQSVELVFTRKTDQTCIKDVVVDTGSKKIEKSLPLNKPVAIKTKFGKAGDLKYACKMNMFSGTVKVQ